MLLRGAAMMPVAETILGVTETEEVFRSAAWPAVGLLRSLSAGEILWRPMWRPQKPLA